MTEEQIPLLLAIAFVTGFLAGLGKSKSSSMTAIVLVGVIILNAVGWMVYGFIVNWQPTWGWGNIMSGVLYAGPGLFLFSAVPAAIGCGIAVAIKRFAAGGK